jgi:hypothetical protein
MHRQQIIFCNHLIWRIIFCVIDLFFGVKNTLKKIFRRLFCVKDAWVFFFFFSLNAYLLKHIYFAFGGILFYFIP